MLLHSLAKVKIDRQVGNLVLQLLKALLEMEVLIGLGKDYLGQGFLRFHLNCCD